MLVMLRLCYIMSVEFLPACYQLYHEVTLSPPRLQTFLSIYMNPVQPWLTLQENQLLWATNCKHMEITALHEVSI
jgi:hypothetical protein